MLLVRKVTGPASAEAGSIATYTAVAFNEVTPSEADLQTINWEVQCGGAQVANALAAGPRFEFTIPDNLAGRTLLVMPYAHSPTQAVSVSTEVTVSLEPITAPAEVTIQTDNQRYSASINSGPSFYVGTDVRYESLRGLMNTNLASDVYKAGDYRNAFGFWADVILPTAICESNGSFHCLNTYDRAAFTYGFYQVAAHTPDQNFVLLLRELLQLPEAQFYFPDLTLSAGRVTQKTSAGLVPLESDTSTQPLMNYLNPDPDAVGQQEAENAAKFVHWAEASPDNRTAQVRFTITQQKQYFLDYANRYNLDGAADGVCIVVADIRHQGRALSTVIVQALAAPDPLAALLEIGATSYPQRIATLKSEISAMTESGVLGQHKYSIAAKDFVPA